MQLSHQVFGTAETVVVVPRITHKRDSRKHSLCSGAYMHAAWCRSELTCSISHLSLNPARGQDFPKDQAFAYKQRRCCVSNTSYPRY